MTEKINTFDPKKNKLVLAGHIDGDCFIRKITSKHYMRKLNAYGMQMGVFNKLMNRDIKKIILISNKNKFESTLEDWKRAGLNRNYGHGMQVFLSVNYMTRTPHERI